ncbi:hypothetical protein ABIC83_002568 [Roseateles asaccharophilus]|uniref:hypothetical protein n=1 Tax=Roseateles asaccharophilus TaxID=582607 RepID=UPI003838A24D
MDFGRQLYQVKQGRVFVREARVESHVDSPTRRPKSNFANSKLIVGMVEVPRFADVERMHAVRMNDHLWMDVESSTKPHCFYGPEIIAESGMADTLLQFGFRGHLLPDSLDVFLRASVLPHDEPDMRWALIAGIVPHGLKAFTKDGLYEIGQAGFTLISENTYNGQGLGTVFREPIWGPGGRYGVAMSMEPARYASWVGEERVRNAKREPMFAAYMERMEARCPLQLYYTAEFAAMRDSISEEIMRDLIAEDEASFEASLPGHTPALKSSRPSA